MAVQWKKLSFEWKLLVGAFILTSIVLFTLSIHLVSTSKSCVTDTCVMAALSLFTWAAFSLLVFNVVVLVIFMFSFYLGEASKPKKKKRTRKTVSKRKKK